MFRTTPTECMPGDDVHACRVADWPKMSGKSAIAFQRFTGVKRYPGPLVRKGKHIFAIPERGNLARCVYAHDREF